MHAIGRIAACAAAGIVLWSGVEPHVRAQIEPAGGADAYVADLAARRASAMRALPPDTILVVWSAPTRTFSADIDYPYRQDSDLLYLTGLTEPGVVLVLVPGGALDREVLFIPRATPQTELWNGHSPTPAEASRASGIARVVVADSPDAVQRFVEARLAPGGAGAPGSASSTASAAGRELQLAIPDDVPDAGSRATPTVEAAAHIAWVRAIQAKYPSVGLVSARPMFRRLRQVKTPYEQALLARSVDLSARAHVAAMKATKPGRWEYQIKAAIEYAFLEGGALSWGYPSIVGSGPNATSLHYLSATRQMREGDLLLVDAAADYQGLTGDITRTYPVSGRFSARQRALYDVVLAAQDAGIAAARPGCAPDDITKAVVAAFRETLRPLGLVDPTLPTPIDEQVALWFPHAPVHGIGVDVHDPLTTIDVGAAFVVEPGLYIRADAFDRLPATPATAALVDRLRPAMEAYRDLGIRVEDSFLMTPAGPRMLSSAAPRGVRELERVVGSGR